jgi:hypothetical protein
MKYWSGGPKGKDVFESAGLNGYKILRGFWRNRMFVDWNHKADGNDEWRAIWNFAINLWIP